MKLLKAMALTVLVVAISGCASVPTLGNAGFSQNTVDDQLARLAGTSKPEGVALSTLYKDETTMRYSLDNGVSFECNGSKSLTEKIDWTIVTTEGNKFTGSKSLMDDCGNSSNWNIVGRYDENYAYIYNVGSGSKRIFKYKIEESGKKLRQVESIFLRNGSEYRKPLRQDGDSYKGKKYYTTYFISQVDAAPVDAVSIEDKGQARSLSDKLIELKSLLEKGLIEQNEFDSKKKSLLDAF